MKYFSITNKFIPIICGFIITFGAIILQIKPPTIIGTIIQRLDNLVYDIRQKAMLQKHSLQDVPIVIIDVDEKSLKAEGHWPWSRDKIANLVDHLRKNGVIVIAIDQLFPEPEPNVAFETLKKMRSMGIVNQQLTDQVKELIPGFDTDRIFATAIKQVDTILGIFFNNSNNPPVGLLPKPILTLNTPADKKLIITEMKSYITNIPLLQQAAQHAASVSILPDEDGIIRKYSLLIRYGDQVYPSLALEAIKEYLLLDTIKLHSSMIGNINTVDSVQLGDTIIPTDQRSNVLISYQGPAFTFPYYSATDVLHDRIPPNKLQNMIAFIGTSAVGLGDLQATPIQSVYPGVEIHADVAASILQKSFLYRPAWSAGAELTVLLLFGIILSILYPYIGPVWMGICSILTLTLIISLSAYFWRYDGLVLPIVLSCILIIVLALFNLTYGFFTENKRRSELKKAFSEYVPPEYVEQIIDATNIAGFEGEKREMTALFMDIRSFTSISEKLSISDIKKMLNFLFTEMTGVIFKHHGTIDKYVGDMVMAFWGAPLPDQNHAQHGVESALEMRETMYKIRPKLVDMNLPEINVGIGLNTGDMNVGDMGSEYRRSYTVLGDSVNLASRLEGLSKFYHVNIIIGELTYKSIKNIVCRQLDRVKVKGKNVAIDIYEPICLQDQLTPELTNELSLYVQALENYFQQQWQLATEQFTQLREQFPETFIYKLFLERIAHFIKNPPPIDWDGSWMHLEK